jgi:hypothetical protein
VVYLDGEVDHVPLGARLIEAARVIAAELP